MKDKLEFTLNNPLTEEQWDMITDVDFDRTDRITFHTKHGKEVEFTKVIRCKECTRFRAVEDSPYGICWLFSRHPSPESFCDRAERRGEK